MDAEHDLPAHAEDLDAAFAEAVANAGPRDQAEPHPVADLPLREPGVASAPAVVDPRIAAFYNLLSGAVHLPVSATADDGDASVANEFAAASVRPAVVAAADERESVAVNEFVPPTVNEFVPAPVATRQFTGGGERQLAVVDLTALGDIEERELEHADLADFAASDLSTHVAVDERQDAIVIHPVHGSVENPQAAPLETVSSRAWIGVMAAVSLAVLAGVVIVLTMLVPSTPGHESVSVDRSAPAAVHTRERAAVTASVTTPAPAWRSTDEWTGGRKKSMAYELAAERPVRLWMRRATPVLVLRCLAGTLDAFVVTGSATAIEPGRTDHTVHLALDDGQPETQHWTDSADHDGLFAPNGPAVVSRLASARRLRFSFTPHNAPLAEATFDVSGIEALQARLGQHCHQR
jgi:hypothetical protein